MSLLPSVEAKKQFEGKLWIGRIYGVANFEEGNKVHPRLAIVVVLGIIEQVMHVHGLTESWPDVALICNSLAVLCLILQLYFRLCSKFLKYDNENLKWLLEAVVSFYEEEEKISSHREILVKNLKICQFLLDGYLITCLVVFSIISPTAWAVSWYTGEYILFTPIYLPITDINTLPGFLISSALLVFYTMLVYVLIMTADIFFMFFVYQCIPMINIFCLKLKNFGDELVKIKAQTNSLVNPLDPSISGNTTRFASISQQKGDELGEEDKIANVEKKLNGIIKQFNKYNEYVHRSTQFIELSTFVAMTLNSMAVAMAMVVTLYYSKAIGVAFVIVLLFQVIVPCLQGTMISDQKQKLLHELYGFPWYELSLSNQKVFLQFIHLCQNSNQFQIALIGQIDMELFMNVINAAYSYLMYLLKFSDNM